MLHVNPALEICGLALFFNPLDNEVVRTWKLPLYYTGLRDRALIRTGEGEPRECVLNRHYEVELELNVPAHGMSWYVVSAGA